MVNDKEVKGQWLPGQTVSLQQLEQAYNLATQKLSRRFGAASEVMSDFGEFLQGYLQLPSAYVQALKDKVVLLEAQKAELEKKLEELTKDATKDGDAKAESAKKN